MYILEHLIQDYPYLFKLCISCESESYTTPSDVCGRCIPCIHLKQALLPLAAHPDSKIREYVNDLLLTKFKIQVNITCVDEYKESETKQESDIKNDNFDTEPYKESN